MHTHTGNDGRMAKESRVSHRYRIGLPRLAASLVTVQIGFVRSAFTKVQTLCSEDGFSDHGNVSQLVSADQTSDHGC
jgi:hypothetical protein